MVEKIDASHKQEMIETISVFGILMAE
uniref:Uncharacterized protein n=1 Tax=Rhizophora mucronata TaxID=61149 RepID=A0A2P2R3J3_RHIMU